MLRGRLRWSPEVVASGLPLYALLYPLLYPILYSLLYPILYSPLYPLLYSPTLLTNSTHYLYGGAAAATLATLTAAPYGPPEPARAQLYHPLPGPSQPGRLQADGQTDTDGSTDRSAADSDMSPCDVSPRYEAEPHAMCERRHSGPICQYQTQARGPAIE